MATQLTKTLKTLKQISTILPKSISTQPALLEFDLSSSVSSSEVVVGIQLLEDAIHRIIVRRLEPNWLAFRPGSSYWVPPSRSIADKLAHLVGRITTPLTPDVHSLFFLDSRGCPSPSYFIHSDQVEGQSDSSISSRWVPPFGTVNDNSVQRFGKLTETDPLTEEESLSVVCAHGWPSSSYFLDQGSPSLGEVQNSENEPLTEHDK